MPSTIAFTPRDPAPLEFPRCSRTLQQSDISVKTRRFFSYSLRALCSVLPARGRPATASQQPSAAKSTVVSAAKDPQKIFQHGEAALQAGNLDAADGSFREALALDPRLVGAYENLGVIEMRRKHWHQAIDLLRKAEKMAPSAAGIRLNIGLAYFRQNDFASAISPFESVVRDMPGSELACYLLRLCYFFGERYPEAATALEPLWPQDSGQLNYLYVLGIAAGKANRPDLEQQALQKLVASGANSPEFHLLIGLLPARNTIKPLPSWKRQPRSIPSSVCTFQPRGRLHEEAGL